MTTSRHQSVLLTEALEALQVRPGEVVVDATVGGAGHFSALREALADSGSLIGIDADSDAIARGKDAAAGASNVHLVNDNFRNLAQILDDLGIEEVDKALFDLGWSSYHLSSGRGFSFQVDEPLLMTYGDPEEGTTAADMINTYPEDKLSEIIFTLGEERFARQIARGIARERSSSRILTTDHLVKVIEDSTPSWYQHRRIHPATKTFQALRMAVNDELGALRDGLTAAIERLSMDGRIAVITFHSIEDRIVKSMLRDAAYAGKGTVITKKPIAPSDAELRANPRARSAKLRVFERSECTETKRPITSYAFA